MKNIINAEKWREVMGFPQSWKDELTAKQKGLFTLVCVPVGFLDEFNMGFAKAYRELKYMKTPLTNTTLNIVVVDEKTYAVFSYAYLMTDIKYLKKYHNITVAKEPFVVRNMAEYTNDVAKNITYIVGNCEDVLDCAIKVKAGSVWYGVKIVGQSFTGELIK